MISNSWEKTAESDFHNFINEGLQDEYLKQQEILRSPL